MKNKDGVPSNSARPSRRKFMSIAAGVAITTTAAALLVAACGGSSEPERADLILQNGAVYTVDKNRSRAEAIAIKDGKIMYVGKNSGLSDLTGPNTKVVNLEERMVLPRFIDTHNYASHWQ